MRGDSQSNTTTINIANVPIQVIIDSSASCNVLNAVDLEKLPCRGLKLRTRNRKLFLNNSPPLKVTHCLVADVQFHDGPAVSTEFLILPWSQSSLLGRETAESLQILEIVNQVSTPSPTVFSKTDLHSGYHRTELDPEARYITTFSIHVGLYRYRRLIFGLNSAAEVFQRTIQEVIAGIPGARNVSDDIVCFGSNQAEHDRALDATLH